MQFFAGFMIILHCCLVLLQFFSPIIRYCVLFVFFFRNFFAFITVLCPMQLFVVLLGEPLITYMTIHTFLVNYYLTPLIIYGPPSGPPLQHFPCSLPGPLSGSIAKTEPSIQGPG